MSSVPLDQVAAAAGIEERVRFRTRLAARGLDGTTLFVLPALLAIVALFVYPFLYGLALSFRPKVGGALANYAHFFSDPFLYDTIYATLRLALPATIIAAEVAIPEEGLWTSVAAIGGNSLHPTCRGRKRFAWM